MRYMLLIYTDESLGTTMTQEEGNAIMAAYYAYGAEATTAGVHLSSEALQPASQAKTVRVRNGKMIVTDGPFAETKEMIGGFFLLNCETKAEAIAIAKECPAAQWCTVEVRELAPCYM